MYYIAVTIFIIFIILIVMGVIVLILSMKSNKKTENFRTTCFDQSQCSQCTAPSDNPFFPMSQLYVQPSLTKNIDALIQKVTDPDVKQVLTNVSKQPSAYWIDKKEKINNQVKDILNDMKEGQKVVFIVYDLPNRDCAALSSNGEICCNTNESCVPFCSLDCQKDAPDCNQGLTTYKTQYIDALVSLFKQYPKITLILIIEPDSLPNCVTNLGQFGCSEITCTAYRDGVIYAVNQLSALPNTVLYLDAGHGGWLGWNNNLQGYKDILKGLGITTKLRGFATNVSNYQSLGEKACAFTGSEYNSFVDQVKANNKKGECGYDPCDLSSQYNAANSEINYVQLLAWAFQDVKFNTKDSRARFVIDTGRNGNSDARLGAEACKAWCNIFHAKVGKFPTTDTSLPIIDAYFWLKTPGESDGCIDYNVQQKCDNTDGFGSQCARYDPNCGTHPENIGYMSFQPCPPEAGSWFDYQMLMLAGGVKESFNAPPVTCFSQEECSTKCKPTPKYYECVGKQCQLCTSCTTFPDDPNCANSCKSDEHHKPGDPFYVDVMNDGKKEKTMWMNTCSDYNTDIDTFGSTILFNNINCRLHTVVSSCTEQCQWKYYDILNKQTTFTVFTGGVPCGYNLAFYTSAIPLNQPYCDGQSGLDCTEIDYMECNAFSWHTTLHKGNDDKGGVPIGVGGTIDQYSQTEQRFIDYNGRSTQNVYGYGKEFLINTENEFKATFIMSAPSGIITKVEVILEQGENKIGQIYKEPYQGYYEELSKELQLKKNVLVVSGWTGGMDWLDSPPCPQQDPPFKASYIKDIVITSLSNQIERYHPFSHRFF